MLQYNLFTRRQFIDQVYQNMSFASIDELQRALATHQYVADRPLATAIFLALKLQKPLLLEGEAGVGKTEVAKTLAQMLGRRLIRLQCYEGWTSTRRSTSGTTLARCSRSGCSKAAARRKQRWTKFSGPSSDQAPAVPGDRGQRRWATDPAARRDREGAPGRLQHPASDPRGREAHRRPGADGGLPQLDRDHDLEHRREGHRPQHLVRVRRPRTSRAPPTRR